MDYRVFRRAHDPDRRMSEIERNRADDEAMTTVRIDSRRFGTIEVEESSLFEFADGLLGLEESTRSLVLVEQEDTPYYWLHSATDPDVAFVVTDPWAFWPDYDIVIPDEVEEELGLAGPEDVGVMVLVSVRPAADGGSPTVTANLLGPLVVSSSTRRGRQLVLDNARYSARQRIGA